MHFPEVGQLHFNQRLHVGHPYQASAQLCEDPSKIQRTHMDKDFVVQNLALKELGSDPHLQTSMSKDLGKSLDLLL